MLTQTACLKFWEYCEALTKEELENDLRIYSDRVKQYSKLGNLALKKLDYAMAESNFMLVTQWCQKCRLIKRALEAK